ncbi:hypothetical protein AVEN_104189-1 [Araneus ventricosus]|uniref:Uncharacterized protein n=1 Tax=Araneus ventricosus TaxID=182803 RepID=A0A4Y2JRM3_ARAVE|nr:hypothetical protein AVEN_104189-1 [Araneus ventricosus]
MRQFVSRQRLKRTFAATNTRLIGTCKTSIRLCAFLKLLLESSFHWDMSQTAPTPPLRAIVNELKARMEHPHMDYRTNDVRVIKASHIGQLLLTLYVRA